MIWPVVTKGQSDRLIDSTDYKNKKDIVDVVLEKKLLDTTYNPPARVGNRLDVSLLPSVGGVPAKQGKAYVTLLTASMFLGDPKTTNLSNIYFFPYTNFMGKWVFPIRSYIWTNNNKWNLVGDYRYLIYPEETYGFGSSTSKSNYSEIKYKHLRIHQSILRNVYGYFLLGAGIRIDEHFNIQTEIDSTEYKTYSAYYNEPLPVAFSSNGIELNAAYDSRLNSLNPQQGIYASFDYAIINKIFGSTYNWSSIYTNLKMYHSFNRHKQNLIAFWALYWQVVSGKPPYLDLPSTLWDKDYKAGRGYYQGRFRGDAMAFIETEYRFDLTKNGLWGGTVWANAQTLRNPVYGTFGKIAPATGVGVRLKFNKFTNTNLTFDVGVGRESWNYYFSLGEYF